MPSNFHQHRNNAGFRSLIDQRGAGAVTGHEQHILECKKTEAEQCYKQQWSKKIAVGCNSDGDAGYDNTDTVEEERVTNTGQGAPSGMQ